MGERTVKVRYCDILVGSSVDDVLITESEALRAVKELGHEVKVGRPKFRFRNGDQYISINIDGEIELLGHRPTCPNGEWWSWWDHSIAACRAWQRKQGGGG